MRPAIAILLALLAAGCARNAIFELELELPAAPPGEDLFVLAQASDVLAFDDDWSGVEGVQLGPLAASCTRADPPPVCEDRQVLDPECSATVSVVSGGDAAEPLRLRVRFCRSSGCELPEDAAAPEARVTVERAFYQGRYTQARLCLDEVPPGPLDVDVARCDVRCREGTAAMQCRADGTHFCEDPL